MSGRILIFYRGPHQMDRWFKGDHRWRAPIRHALRGPDPIGGLDLVYLNLCAGLDRLGVDYETNIPFSTIKDDDHVGVIGRGRASLEDYNKDNPIVAGVAVAQHPDEWPDLFKDYPVSRYVVHCEWVARMFRRIYGDQVSKWAVGIDTEAWCPSPHAGKTVDFLIYDKVRWSHERLNTAMTKPICDGLERRGLSYEIIKYGHYKPADLAACFKRCKALIFLCEHESQGLAYQQAMSAGLPVLAWDQGHWLDPWRFRYGGCAVLPATSVPFFDDQCGVKFADLGEFEQALTLFLDRQVSGQLAPREYVLENLTLEKCARDYVDILMQYT